MKNQVLMILAFAYMFSFASRAFAATPDFVCLEQSGFRYEFFFSKFTEIHIFDEKGQALDHLDGLKVERKFKKSNPVKEQFAFVYADGGNKVAVIEFEAGKTKGRGEMIDNDQKMTCVRSAASAKN